MFPNLKSIERHQDQQVPEEAKEIDRLGQATLARVEQMKMDALKKFGHWNPNFGCINMTTVDHDKLFPIGPRGASDNAPKIKLGAIMQEKALSRELLQIARIPKIAGPMVSKT